MRSTWIREWSLGLAGGWARIARGFVCGLATQARSASYDAVFDFGIIHHIRDWRRALAEVHRVLKPGGQFYAEEVLARTIVHPIARRLLDHPQEDRFDSAAFARELKASGLDLIATEQLWRAFAWFAARKPA